MKKLLEVIILVLAINFLAVAGGAGWLWKSGHLDKARFADVRKVLFPPPATQPEAPVADGAATQPSSRLDDLLLRASGRTAADQVEFIRQTFDAQATQLDRRERELADLQRQVEYARVQMGRDRSKLEADQQELTNRQQLQTKLASDKGFQDSLTLYTTLPAKQVKTIFMTLDDTVMEQYLQAMDPKTAGKIMKEFKTPDEMDRIQKVMEKMRQASLPTTDPALVKG